MAETFTVSALIDKVKEIKLKEKQRDTSRAEINEIFNDLSRYLRGVIHQHKQSLATGKWYDAAHQLKIFLTTYHSFDVELDMTTRVEIMAFMVSALVNLLHHEEFQEVFQRASQPTKSSNELQAKFRDFDAFKKLKPGAWDKLFPMYLKMTAMNFFMKEPHKQVMETAAFLLVQNKLKCVTGGSPAKFLTCVHYIYHEVTGTVMTERYVAESRKSKKAERYGYKESLSGVRKTREEFTDSMDSPSRSPKKRKSSHQEDANSELDASTGEVYEKWMQTCNYDNFGDFSSQQWSQLTTGSELESNLFTSAIPSPCTLEVSSSSGEDRNDSSDTDSDDDIQGEAFLDQVVSSSSTSSGRR
eukprot:gene24134-29190_t